MKKLLVLIIGVMVAVSGSLMAENIAFSYGTNFLSPSNSGFATSNGRTSILEWQIDTGLRLAVVNEQSDLDYTDAAGTQEIGSLALNGIRVTQDVIDRVTIGLGLGSATANMPVTASQVTSSVVDVIGEVTIFSGSGDKVEGSLVASVAARYMNTNGLASGIDAIADLNGSNLGLSVKLGF